MGRNFSRTVTAGLTAVTLGVFVTGAAYAVSGGGYSSPQQDCTYYASDWNTPQYQTYPGCHDVAVTLESGGTTGGMPDNGYNDSPTPGDHGATNDEWVAYGNDQAPNDSGAKGTPGLLSIGEPGQSTSPHAGCLAVNTDGTHGGAAPAGSTPESPGVADSQQQYGCGNNPNGTGFDLAYNLYSIYCPLVAKVESLACEQIPGGDVGPNELTPDTGTQQDLTEIATKGALLYFGMDDNIDNGEHDGEGPYSSPQTDGSIAGASDGGGTMISLTPQSAAATPSLTNWEGLFNFSLGFCFDGYCGETTTQQQTLYYGCDANTGENAADDQCTGANGPDSSRNVADYSGKQWDPEACSSGGEQGDTDDPEPDSPAACDTSPTNPSPSGASNPSGGEDYWRQHEDHTVVAEPGITEYEDPDAQGSPDSPLYPDPALYVGSCGVIVGGGQFPALPASAVTNSAGQLDVNLC
jgi:hypothetical protein